MIDAQTEPRNGTKPPVPIYMRCVRDHHRLIRRVAVVSDSPVLSHLPQLAKHFVAAEVRHFPRTERSGALDWLRSA